MPQDRSPVIPSHPHPCNTPVCVPQIDQHEAKRGASDRTPGEQAAWQALLKDTLARAVGASRAVVAVLDPGNAYLTRWWCMVGVALSH